MTYDKYKRWKQKHDLKEAKRRHEFRKYKRDFRRRTQGLPKAKIGEYNLNRYSPYSNEVDKNDLKNGFKDYKHVPAPKDFSMVGNPEEFISFVHDVQECYKKKQKVFIEMADIENLSDDAIVILLSNMIRFKEHHIRFNGDFPKNEIACNKLKKSGFFRHLYRRSGPSINNMEGTIYTHGNKKADSVFSSEIIEASSRFVWGEPRRCPGIQNTFTELMANTYKHASKDVEGKHYWWMSMTKDEKEHKVVYGFVDYGIGIFNSLNHKQPGDRLYAAFQKLKSEFSMLSFGKANDKIMEKILKGELHKTVTKQTNRGKGLPSIYKNWERNEIDSLVIITNNVYADVKNGDYHLLGNEFVGTFVKWEMNPNIKNLRNNNG